MSTPLSQGWTCSVRSGRRPFLPPYSGQRFALEFSAGDTAGKLGFSDRQVPKPGTPFWLPPPKPPAWAPAAGRAQDGDGSERCLKPSRAKGQRSSPPPRLSPPRGRSPCLPPGPPFWPLRGALDRRDRCWLGDTAPWPSKETVGPEPGRLGAQRPYGRHRGPDRIRSRSPSSEEMSPGVQGASVACSLLWDASVGTGAWRCLATCPKAPCVCGHAPYLAGHWPW